MSGRKTVDLVVIAFGEDPEDKASIPLSGDQPLALTHKDTSKGKRPAGGAEKSTVSAERAPKRKREAVEAASKKAPSVTLHEIGTSEPTEVWEPPMSHSGRRINVMDSVMNDMPLAVDLTKSLLLPLNMADHNMASNEVLVFGSIQFLTTTI